MPQVIKNILTFIALMVVYGMISKATACDQALPIDKGQPSPCKGVLLPEAKEAQVRAEVFRLQKEASKVPLLEQKAELLAEKSKGWEEEAKKQAVEADKAEGRVKKAGWFGAGVASLWWLLWLL
jgi:hypothetical protein